MQKRKKLLIITGLTLIVGTIILAPTLCSIYKAPVDPPMEDEYLLKNGDLKIESSLSTSINERVYGKKKSKLMEHLLGWNPKQVAMQALINM